MQFTSQAAALFILRPQEPAVERSQSLFSFFQLCGTLLHSILELSARNDLLGHLDRMHENAFHLSCHVAHRMVAEIEVSRIFLAVTPQPGFALVGYVRLSGSIDPIQ